MFFTHYWHYTSYSSRRIRFCDF